MPTGKQAEHWFRQLGGVPGFVGNDEDFDAYRERAAREAEEAGADDTPTATSPTDRP